MVSENGAFVPEPKESIEGDFSDAGVEQLFSGDLTLTDPQWRGLVSVAHRMRSATLLLGGDAWMRQQASAASAAAIRPSNVATLPTSGLRKRRLVVAAAVAAAAVIGTAGLAAADTLPRPVQGAVARMARVVGVDLPGGEDSDPAGGVLIGPGHPAPTTPAVTAPDQGESGVEQHDPAGGSSEGSGRDKSVAEPTPSPGETESQPKAPEAQEPTGSHGESPDGEHVPTTRPLPTITVTPKPDEKQTVDKNVGDKQPQVAENH